MALTVCAPLLAAAAVSPVHALQPAGSNSARTPALCAPLSSRRSWLGRESGLVAMQGPAQKVGRLTLRICRNVVGKVCNPHGCALGSVLVAIEFRGLQRTARFWVLREERGARQWNSVPRRAPPLLPGVGGTAQECTTTQSNHKEQSQVPFQEKARSRHWSPRCARPHRGGRMEEPVSGPPAFPET